MLTSDSVKLQVNELLVSGQASTEWDAEEKFLDAHLNDIVELVGVLDDQEFEGHEAIKLLMSHGSRR